MIMFVAIVVFVAVFDLTTPAPQGGIPPGRVYNPNRFVPLNPQGFIPIVSQNYDLNPLDNSYNFNYVSGDGSERHEVGVLANPGTQAEGIAVQGSYFYTSPDGTQNQVNYVADNFGYQPSGPNIHPAIIKAVQEQVEEARANPQPQQYYPNRNNF